MYLNRFHPPVFFEEIKRNETADTNILPQIFFLKYFAAYEFQKIKYNFENRNVMYIFASKL